MVKLSRVNASKWPHSKKNASACCNQLGRGVIFKTSALGGNPKPNQEEQVPYSAAPT
jgi:hypothetical protein